MEWKTINGKQAVEGNNRPTAENSLITFNEQLQLTTEMLYDNDKEHYLKKESLLNLNLISKARQDQVKLVGRITIDLAEVANLNKFQ